MNAISAHAQTLTQADASSLQASVDALKAKFAELQAQAGVQRPPVLRQAPPISEADARSLNSALSALAGVLTTLQSEFSANPGFAAQNSGGVIIALQGIGNTLAMIGTSLQGAPSASVAAAPKAGKPTIAQAPAASPLPSDGANTQSKEEAPLPVSIPATAEVSSAWSLRNFNWPLVAAVVLIVAAIALWLWWPTKEKERDGNDKGSAKKNMPQTRPTVIVSSSGPQISVNTAKQAVTPQAPTPLAASISVPVVKVVPPEQQRRSA